MILKLEHGEIDLDKKLNKADLYKLGFKEVERIDDCGISFIEEKWFSNEGIEISYNEYNKFTFMVFNINKISRNIKLIMNNSEFNIYDILIQFKMIHKEGDKNFFVDLMDIDTKLKGLVISLLLIEDNILKILDVREG